MYNSLVMVYGFEDDCLNIDNKNIISCNTIGIFNKNMYCNISTPVKKKYSTKDIPIKHGLFFQYFF